MSRNAFSLAISILFCILTACSGGDNANPNPSGSNPDENTLETTTEKSINSPKIEQFVVDYSPPSEITEKVGDTAKLTYSVKVKTEDFAGIYTFFDCVDISCETKHSLFTIKCDKKRACEAFDNNNSAVGKPDYIWTFAYLWSPVYNPKTKEWDSWTGLDLYFVDPNSFSDGFHNQHFAAQFEYSNGTKTDLKVFHFKK